MKGRVFFLKGEVVKEKKRRIELTPRLKLVIWLLSKCGGD